MGKILSVASSGVLKTTRRLLLEHQGFIVCSALDLAEVESLGKTPEQVDLALVCHGFRGAEKRKIANVVTTFIPGFRSWRCASITRNSGSGFYLDRFSG